MTKGAMPEDPKPNRRHARIATPKGIWVAWQDGSQGSVSRVRDLNVGGLFIATPVPPATGKAITLLLSVPEGEIRAKATIRNVTPGEGMGVAFTEISPQDTTKLDNLIARLLSTVEKTPS
jgi:hypothetical protein